MDEIVIGQPIIFLFVQMVGRFMFCYRHISSTEISTSLWPSETLFVVERQEPGNADLKFMYVLLLPTSTR